tara:strand:+ start:256 stop:1251 length:996 start_codon:yes stop_codon:yes gene_type:complete
MKTIGILAAITSLGMLTAAAQTQKTPPQPASPNAPVATEATVSPPRAATGKPTIVTVKPKPSRLVQALDSNQDGKLSVEEIEAAVAILKGLDQDGNGELTSDEFGPVMTSKKQQSSRAILRPTSTIKPSAAIRPNRPGRRPTAKPAQPGTKPTRVVTSKKPTSRLKRATARTRPAGRPSRRVSKASLPADTIDQSPGTAAPARANKPRVFSSNARKKSRTNSRRNTTVAVDAKPKVLPTPPQKGQTEGISTKEELIVLQEEAKQILEDLKQAAGAIKDRKKKQSVLQWVRKDYRQLSQSLNAGLRSKDVESQRTLIEEIKQKLAEAKQLLE